MLAGNTGGRPQSGYAIIAGLDSKILRQCAAWTCRSEWIRVTPQGFPGATNGFGSKIQYLILDYH